MQRKDLARTQGEGGHLQAQERGFRMKPTLDISIPDVSLQNCEEIESVV